MRLSMLPKFESLEERELLTVVHDINVGVEGHQYVQAEDRWGEPGRPEDSAVGSNFENVQVALPVEDGLYAFDLTIHPRWNCCEQIRAIELIAEGGEADPRNINNGHNELRGTVEVFDGELNLEIIGVTMPPMLNQIVVTKIGDVGDPCDEPLLGDADNDGEVAFSDFLILSKNFGKTDAAFADGDFDLDGTVGFSDFLALSDNFGDSCAK